MNKRKSDPQFVKARIVKGEVWLTDNDGEKYHISMHRDKAWPILSKPLRNFEMRQSWEEHKKRMREENNPKPEPFGPPRLVPPAA